jgi:hypothetical protein
MSTRNPSTPSYEYEPVSHLEEVEADTALAVGAGLRAIEVAAVVLLGLLVVPPLAILAVVVILPLLVIALVLGLVVAVLSIPYLLVHHFRGGDHASLFMRRLRGAGRAVHDLLPHRIAADASKADQGRRPQ